MLTFTVNELERDGGIFHRCYRITLVAMGNRFKGSKDNKLLGVEVTSANTVPAKGRTETGCSEDRVVRFTNGSRVRRI